MLMSFLEQARERPAWSLRATWCPWAPRWCKNLVKHLAVWTSCSVSAIDYWLTCDPRSRSCTFCKAVDHHTSRLGAHSQRLHSQRLLLRMNFYSKVAVSLNFIEPARCRKGDDQRAWMLYLMAHNVLKSILMPCQKLAVAGFDRCWCKHFLIKCFLFTRKQDLMLVTNQMKWCLPFRTSFALMLKKSDKDEFFTILLQ